MRPQKLQRVALHRHLQGGADEPHLVDGLARTKENMDMFGHEDVGPEGQSVIPSCSLHGIYKPPARTIAAQQGQPAETGEGQFVGMTWYIVAADTLAMRRLHVTGSAFERAERR